MAKPKSLYTKPKRGEEIVVSGMSGIFPDTHNIYHFRDNLFNKVDLLTIDNRRWIPTHPDVPLKCGKVFDIQSFDAGFFGITQLQGDSTDPMLRIGFEKSLEAIMDAGHHPSDLAGTRTGVFCAASMSESELYVYLKVATSGSDAPTGMERSMLAQRISYFLQLESPAFTVDTACSSAMSALDQAYQAIREGKCDKAIVLSVQLCLIETITLQFTRLGAISRDGSCKPFDENTTGYTRSEAIVAIFLEKSKDAKRNYAELVHCKTSSDGFKQHGITFPSSDEQVVLMKEFYNEISMDPGKIRFIEAHGTGTRAGDPVEAKSIYEVFCKDKKREPLYIGSVKSNVGHTECSSAFCSIVKILLSMETGFIPPNIHFKTPIKDLRDKNIIVVTEKTPLPYGYVPHNSFGFGGSNGHTLLHWNEKSKINNGQPKDNLPRLICVSGRTETGVTDILDDFKSRNCDSEYAYIIQQVFKKAINNIYRGYGIYTKQNELMRSFRRMDKYSKGIHLVFDNFDQPWSKLGNILMSLPTFAKTTEQIHDILREKIDVNFPDIFSNSVQVNAISQFLRTITTQIGLANVLTDIKLKPHKITGMGSGELIAAYMDNYLTLKQTVLALFYMISNINKGDKMNCEVLEKLITAKNNSYKRWVPINEGKLRANPSKYFVHNIIRSYDNDHIKKSNSKDEVLIVVGSKTGDVRNDAMILVDEYSQNPIIDFLSNLGSLYESGIDMEIDKLYPPIELPVSRGTPMLSPLIRWDHRRPYNTIPVTEYFDIRMLSFKTVSFSVKDEDWTYITGHVIDGRNLFPATGYLYLVWQCFNRLVTGKLVRDSRLVFEDVSFIRATPMPKEDEVTMIITIQPGTHRFWVEEGGAEVVTGKIYEMPEENALTDLPTRKYDEDSMCLEAKDIYKELKLRGYFYSGQFKKVKKSNIDSSQAIIEWDDNWVAFLDNFLQVLILQKDTRYLYVPTTIQQLTIDAPRCLREIERCNNMVSVYSPQKGLSNLRAEGVELRSVGVKPIGRRKIPEAVWEYSEFIPNEAFCGLTDSIRIFIQVVLENCSTATIKAVEVLPDEDVPIDLLICPFILDTLKDLPAVNQDLKILTSRAIELPEIRVENGSLKMEPNSLLVVVSDVLGTEQVSAVLHAISNANGFVISRENAKADPSKFIDSPFSVLCTHRNNRETLFLLRAKEEHSRKICYSDLTGSADNYQWIERLQNNIKLNDKVILYSQNEETSGLLGFFTCLLREQSSNKVACFLIMDKAPQFDPDLDFYKKQLDKNMAINIWKDSAWGTYKHLLLPKNQITEGEHCYANPTTIGDLSTLTWMAGNLTKDTVLPPEMELVDIYYSALNFRDLMTASGRLSPDLLTTDRVKQQCVQGFEFAGRDSRGRRVMGTCLNGAMASIVACDKHMLFPIPDDWTMEDAATVCIVYVTVIQSLVVNYKLTPGQSILIHSGTGGVGQAAINVSQHFGLNIFVTVGTPEKRQFIRKHFPQIKQEHIGNSRDTSFEVMVQQYTNGRGVDYVLNSLSEEKLLASVRCLARGGKFLEIGKFDLANNSMLALKLLEKDAEFAGIGLDRCLERCSVGNASFVAPFMELLKCGAVKPLNRTVFKMEEIEKAFRFISTGKHLGKILLKIRDEEHTKIHCVPRTLFKTKPRFYCNPEHSYLICGGLGGFGLELADFLFLRGARKLVLTSKSGVHNGYQRYRLSVWKNSGANVLTTTCCASTEKGCTELIEMANELGPVGGIFNLGAVLRDALFEDQTVEDFETSMIPKAYTTRFLDSISRRLCPNLKYFVVFSSLSCGRGNVGQTNYGMANSIMERICEKRKREGYPALAIQWGAVGDVGLVAQMQEEQKELVICGTLQQRITSCIEVLDQFLMQNHTIVSSMVVAEKRSGRGLNAFEDVLDIIGIKNVNTVSMYFTLPELGMDSMMAVEIKQSLERDYEIFLTPQEIRVLTLAKLQALCRAEIPEVKAETKLEKEPEKMNLLVRFIGDEASSNVPVIKMKTLVGDDEDAPHIFVLPGIEGTAVALEGLCKKLKAHVSCLQFCNKFRIKTTSDLVQLILPTVQSTTGDLMLLAHSYGCLVATELLRILELNGRQARVIYMDGSADALHQFIRLSFPTEDENLLQSMILTTMMVRVLSYDSVLKHQDEIAKFTTYEEKVNYVISSMPQTNYSVEYLTEATMSAYERVKTMLDYRFEGAKLKSKLTFFRATPHFVPNAAPDYGLANQFENPIDVISIRAGHVEMLEDQNLADEINKILKTL